jgi:8-hydroxy-5-deazaflavin:NADPH oxidoreductase
MKIGIVGAGRIGGNAARLLAAAGHETKLSFARDPSKLRELAETIGERASVGDPADAVSFGEVVIFSVPWDAIPVALEQAGDLTAKVVIDTTNQFGSGPKPAAGQTAAQFNIARMPGARYTKSFNTLTAAFQAEAAGRVGSERVVQWICGDDVEAKEVVANLVDDAGFAPVDPWRHGRLCRDGSTATRGGRLRRGVPARGRSRGRGGRARRPTDTTDPAVLGERDR